MAEMRTTDYPKAEAIDVLDSSSDILLVFRGRRKTGLDYMARLFNLLAFPGGTVRLGFQDGKSIRVR